MLPAPAFSFRRSPLAVSPALGASLARAYRTPPRAYHHAGHVDEVLRWYDWAARTTPWTQPREVFVAVLFHDAVYVSGARDNEARSAELAVQAIDEFAELAGLDAARVAQLIRWTAQHGRLSSGDVDDEAARFLDCDLAILAAPAARYRQYRAEIAQEYRSLPAEGYREGRLRFVTQLVERPRLFLSELFSAHLEAAARSNLAAEIAELQG
jgi:predicted metal-dependent HD superfamily phosphohydrolase